MSLYQNLSSKIYLLEKRLKETGGSPRWSSGEAGRTEPQPWYLSAAWRTETIGYLKLGFYKSLLALVRLGLILRGRPASNFTVFTRAGKDGLYICNYSYCYYKDFHNKTRNKTIATIIAATVLLSIIVSLIFPGEPRVKAAAYNFSQTNWSGDTDGGVYPNHTSNQSSWTKYSAKDSDIVASSTNLTLANAASNFLDTTNTDFNGFSNSGGGTWSYYRPIIITGSTAGAQTDYQVNVSLNTAVMGNPYTSVKTDGSDIRFANASGTELSYWIESWNNTDTSSVWVKVDSIPTSPSTTTINMYYGNSSATSASSSTNTFAGYDAAEVYADSNTTDTIRKTVTFSTGGQMIVNYKGMRVTGCYPGATTRVKVNGAQVGSDWAPDCTSAYTSAPSIITTVISGDVLTIRTDDDADSAVYIKDLIVRKYASPEPGIGAAGGQQSNNISYSSISHSNTVVSGTGTGAGVTISGCEYNHGGADWTPANGDAYDLDSSANIGIAGTHCNIGLFTVASGTTYIYGYNGTNYGKLTVYANNITIASGGTLDATGKGYGAASGPGAGNTVNWGNGGAYGGNGGIINPPGVTNAAYTDSATLPNDLGSGGGLSNGTPGGGLIKLNASGALVISGSILSNSNLGSASNCNDTAPGMGSGGGIYVNGASLSGSGSIHANGAGAAYISGYCHGGGGSGGRVALYYNYSSFPTGNVQVTGGASGGGSQIPGASGTFYDGGASSYQSYIATGTFTSSIKNTGASNYWGNIVFNTALNGGTITMKVRTSNSATMSGAPDWSTCNAITSGTSIAGNNCVISPAQYVQYQATLNNGTTFPLLNDITIYYGGYVPSATLTSSAFNTQNAGNVLSKLTWTENLLVNTDVKFQVRTAPDSGSNTPGTWTAWCGPDDGVSGSCSSATYFTAPAGTETIDDINRDGYANQWIQYKVWLTSSDGINTPTLSGVSPEYTINTAPLVGSVTASQGSDGIVPIGYSISDAEQTSVNVSLLADIGVTLNEVLANSTDPGGGAVTVSSASLLPTSGAIQIENEQITYTGKSGNDLTGATRAANNSKYAGHSSGAVVWVKGTTVSGSAGTVTGITSTPAAKTATWTIKTDLPGVFRDIAASPAKIRVSANDLQSGNPTGAADSAVFTLDTKNPAGAVPIIVDSTISSPTANLTLSASDDSTFQMRFANAANQTTPDCATDLYNKTEGQVAYVSYAASYVHHPLSPNSDGISTVCYEFKDAYNNKLQGSASTPKTPASPQITDISQIPLSKYRDLVWWTAQGGSVTYKVYRDSGSGYALLSTATDPTNYCFDEGDGNCADNNLGTLTSTTAYSYKIRAEDTDGISSYSSVVTATPNGLTVGEVDATPPSISFTEATQGPSTANSTLGDSTASITFSATDASGNYFGSVLYEASASLPATYSKESASPSLITSGNTITVNLAGLASNTKYYYKLKARDNSGNAATNDNGGAGYFFTTTIDSTAPAAISSLSATVASSSSAALIWTSPGDDNSAGTATSYDIRYSTSAITDANWSSATQVANEPKPAVAGTSQTMTVTGLNPTGAGATYYFAVKTSDEIPNTSSLSNVVSVDIPAQADTSAPVITDVYTSVVGTNTAIINWTTDKRSSSLIDFGASASFGTTQGISTDSTKNHSVTLIGLSPATKYYYRVKSIDSSGNVAAQSEDSGGQDYSFTTSTDPAAGTLPTISSVQASEITSSSAQITWSTGSTEADSTVGYSIDKSYALEAGTSTPSSGLRSVTLTGLAPSTTYYYHIKSRNGNKLAVSDNGGAGFNFTTLSGADSIAPSISNVQVSTITSNKATISWTTDENSNSYVEFGLAVNAYTSIQGNPNDSVTTHSVQLASLTPEKKYYFQVRSSDAAGNKAVDNNSGAGYTLNTTTGVAIDCPPAGRTVSCPACETCATADAAAPKITGVKVTDITFSSATINWNTDKGSNSMVLYDNVSYGVKQGYAYSAGQLKDFRTAHKVTLNNLDSNAAYYFRVSSADSRGNTAESDDQSFKTIAISEAKDKGESAAVSLKKQFEDIAQTLVKQNLATEENIKDIISRIANPPIIGQEGPVVKEVRSYGATIIWQTDRKANSVVKFKAAFSPTEALAAGNNWKEIGKMDAYDTKHEVELLGLAPSTTYAFQVKSQDVLGNSTSSETKTFTTSSNSSIFNVNVTDITLNSAKINWETVNLSTSLVEYGLTSGYGNQTNKGDEKVKAHGVELTNLSSGTSYHFRIRSVEESGNILSTEDYAFSTYQLPQITKYDLGEIKDNSIELQWTSNLAIDSNIRYTDKETNETKIIGAPEKTLDHSIVLTGLSAGKAYKIEIQGRDEAGNLAELPAFEAQTGMDTIPPDIGQVRSQAAILGGAEDKVQAIISWKTNELSTSQVLWDMGTTKGDAFANATKIDPNLTTNHISVITNFKPGTVYRFRVVSLDKFGNTSVSPDYSILTPVRRQSVVQMIMSNFEKIFGWTKNLGR